MANESERYSVILTRDEFVDTMALAKILAAVRKTPLQDQVIPARNAWGILAENVSQADAESLAHQLSVTIPSRAWPSSAIAILPPATPLLRWEEGLTTDCLVIAAASITITTTTKRLIKEGPTAAQTLVSTGIMLTTGLPIKIGPKKRTIEKKTENSDQLFYVDLVYQDRRRRIDAQKFDYSFLNERKLYNLLGNFKLLLGDLVRGAAGASLGQGTRIFMENKPLQSMRYGSLKDLEREERWLMTLRDLPHSSTE